MNEAERAKIDLKKVAHHEVAHAVAASVLTSVSSFAVIFPNPVQSIEETAFLGKTEFGEPSDTRSWAIIGMIGEAASLMCDDTGGLDLETELEEIWEWSDVGVVSQTDLDSAGENWREYIGAVVEFLTEYWPDISQGASSLIESVECSDNGLAVINVHFRDGYVQFQ